MKKLFVLIVLIISLMCSCFACQNQQGDTRLSVYSGNDSIANSTKQSGVVSSTQNSLSIKNSSLNSSNNNASTQKGNNSTNQNSNSKNSSASVSVSIPKEINSKLDEAINSIVLYENNEINRDIIVLPRVSLKNIAYISWETSNSNIIDIFGNVKQTNSTQNVILTATYTLEGYSKQKTYQVKVLPKQQDSTIVSVSDTRIIKKISVSNASEFKTALKSAVPGDAIILKNGDYSQVVASFDNSGTKNSPIFIIAENANSANFIGKTCLKFSGDNIVISGLSFKNGSPNDVDSGAVLFLGNYCRLSNCKFLSFNDSGVEAKWVSLKGKYCEIDNNVFDGKATKGALLTVWRDDTSAQYHHIHDNLFSNYETGSTANGYEVIRVGDSTNSQTDSFCLVENNQFKMCNGEIENISVKSGRNVFRNNNFVECKSNLTLRHGKNNLVVDNVFLDNNVADTGGIRAYDGGHIVRNNYVYAQNSTSDSRGAFVCHSGVNEVGTLPVINLQWTAYNCEFSNNTAIDCVQSFVINKKYNYDAKDIVLKNNLISSSSNAGIRCDGSVLTFDCENNLAYSSQLLTSQSKNKNFNCFELKPYINLIASSNGLYEVSGCGASGLKVFN